MKIFLVRYFFKITYLLVKYELDQALLPKYLAPSRLGRQKFKAYSVPEKLRLFLEVLGPLWVKFGQILSTRHDVFPSEWIEVLSGLQDAVEPFEKSVAFDIIASNIPDYKKHLTIEGEVLASASIAQVYAAKINSSQEDVVVKVLRPNVKKLIARDIKSLKIIARICNYFVSDAKRLHLLEVVDELDHSLKQEINFFSEAANAATFARHFANDTVLKIPKVYWEYSSENIIVLERVVGTPIYDVESLKEQGCDLEGLAVKGVELFFTQVLRDSFFHADMHPGNIFVNNKQFALVDFGIVGSLNGRDQRYIAENMLAFFKRDYRKVAVLHIESGWVPENTRIEHFESAIRQVCEPIFARPIKDISFAHLFLQLLRTAREFKTEIQPQLILLQKTLLQVEALGRMLAPDLDLWQVVQPQLEKWVKSQMGLEGFKAKSAENLPYWLEHAPDIPSLIYNYLAKEPIEKHIVLQTNSVWPFIAGASLMALLLMVFKYVI